MSFFEILSQILMNPFIKFGLNDSFSNWTESLNL